jgi:hypothetical protein
MGGWNAMLIWHSNLVLALQGAALIAGARGLEMNAAGVTVVLSEVEWLFWTTGGCCVYIIGGQPAASWHSGEWLYLYHMIILLCSHQS